MERYYRRRLLWQSFAVSQRPGNGLVAVAGCATNGFAMTELEKQILQSLLDLDEAIRSMPTASPKPDLLAHFGRLDTMTNELPRTTSPNLLHYLHKKSYEKARLYLQERFEEIHKGGCRND